MSERNTSKVFVELLRGRDGLPGRDGCPGPAGPPGKDGVKGKEGPSGPLNGVVTYTRWGSRTCPSGAELVYSGVVGGSHWTQGGGANFLCMPKDDPEYTLPYRAGVRNHSYLSGIGYRTPMKGRDNSLAACTVCCVQKKSTTIMIPAKTSCPTNWEREYYGYLMSGYIGFGSNHHTRYMYECIDKDMDTIIGSQSGRNGEAFHHVEVKCNLGLECSTSNVKKYEPHKEMNCVVCSK